MNIADEKKRNNISEYIIHMYQTEDLIRAFDFDMELIKEYVLKHIPADEVKHDALTEWYLNILNEMKSEGISKQGHLKSVQKYVDELTELKDNLLLEDEDFIKTYQEAKSHIDEMMGLSNGLVKSEVQICLNGVYGLLLARIQGREVPEDVMKSIEMFGNVLSYLSFKYKQQDFMREN